MSPQELRDRRLALNLTQDVLAAMFGVHPNTLAKWERGTLPLGHPALVGLALEALEVRRGRPSERSLRSA